MTNNKIAIEIIKQCELFKIAPFSIKQQRDLIKYYLKEYKNV